MYRIYETKKQEIAKKAKSAEEYEMMIKKLIKELGI